jgi:prepilin-type N-terminal cleavage/methylation domain-containing protein
MKSPTASIDKGKGFGKSDKGFTLFEIIVVIALIAGLFAVGSFVDLSMINRNLLSTEEATLVSVLQKAQNEAMNNIDAKPHGVHIDINAYTLFEGTTYSSSSTTNEVINRNSKIVVSGINDTAFTLPYDIVFEQLSGEPNPTGLITLKETGGVNQKDINIRSGGLIDW